MIPKGLEHHHFLKAIREIDENDVPPSRTSYRYDLLLHGKCYPPKYVIYLATQIAGLEPKEYNAVEAKNYFIHHGFTILEKSGNRSHTLGHIANEDEESNFAEGKEKYKTHRAHERDPSIAKKAKTRRLSQHQDLRCDVCDFSFFEMYGKLGEGYIEAHHTVPVSQLRGEKKTRISDIALVCANCHRILHRSKPLLSILELKQIIKPNK